MSVREEDRQRNCPSRGFGIAAAAIGVGVGAALYYFFNKRNENPDASGSTSNWTDEETHALPSSLDEDSNTSNIDSASDSSMDRYDEMYFTDDTDLEESHVTVSDVSVTDADTSDASVHEASFETISEHDTTDTSVHDTSHDHNMIIVSNLENMSEIDAFWANWTESLDGWVPVMPQIPNSPSPSSLDEYTGLVDDIVRRPPKCPLGQVERLAKEREQKFRERSWAIEQCSICFETMQRDQHVMALACTHRFHQACIMPWLEQRQNCPNCRKEA